MKKITVLLISLMVVIIISGCNQKEDINEKLNIVCTVFPQYDWVRQIIGERVDNFNLTLLLKNRIDLHNYQPSVDSIVTISTCDLFIYIGGESDKWVVSVLNQAVNPNMTVINLVDKLGSTVKAEEFIEGMEEDADEDEHEGDFDEHVWLSLKNAVSFCSVIAEALSSLDAKNAEEYQNNLKIYVQKLLALDDEYQTAISTAPINTLLFGDRFPFRYLVDDYGLNYYAAFPGCSAETEASFETIIFLAKKADELALKNIMVTESSDQSIAKTIIGSASGNSRKILVLDAMQSITMTDAENGASYLSIMENNLAVLKEALK